MKRHENYSQFKGKINVFKANFNAKNTFNFRTELTQDEHFMEQQLIEAIHKHRRRYDQEGYIANEKDDWQASPCSG